MKLPHRTDFTWKVKNMNPKVWNARKSERNTTQRYVENRLFWYWNEPLISNHVLTLACVCPSPNHFGNSGLLFRSSHSEMKLSFFRKIFSHFNYWVGLHVRDFHRSNDHTILNSANIFLPLQTSSAWLFHILKNIECTIYHHSFLLTIENLHDLADNMSVSTSSPS